MAITIANLATILSADTTGFAAGFARADNTLKKFHGTHFRVTAAATALGTMLGHLATRGLDAVASAARKGFEDLDQLGKAADRLGVATESLGAVKYAADLAGISFDQLETSATQLLKRLSEAKGGKGDTAVALKELGLSARSLMGMPLDRQLMAISKGLERIGNASDKTRIAMSLFGKSGAAMLNLLDKPVDLELAMKRSGRLNLLFDRGEARRVEMFRDQLSELGLVFESIVVRLGSKFLPQLSAFAEGLAKFGLILEIAADGWNKFINSPGVQMLIGAIALPGNIMLDAGGMGGFNKGLDAMLDDKLRKAMENDVHKRFKDMDEGLGVGDKKASLFRGESSTARIATGLERYGREGGDVSEMVKLLRTIRDNTRPRQQIGGGLQMPVVP